MDEGVVLDLGLITSLVFLAVLLALSVYWEMKEHRIPNWLTVSGMLAGLMLAYLRGGETLISSLVGLGIGFGFLFIFYVFGGIGGGDVKLMGAIGALLGHKLVVPALFYTAVIGGIHGGCRADLASDFPESICKDNRIGVRCAGSGGRRPAYSGGRSETRCNHPIRSSNGGRQHHGTTHRLITRTIT